MLGEVELRDIPGYEGRYAASSDGRIWSHRRRQWLAVYLTNGYERADVFRAGKVEKARVHRLVALAWISNPSSAPEVNHIDGNKRNNAPANLEWSNRSQNLKHSVRVGLRKPQSNRHGAKLTVEKVGVIKARLARGEKCNFLAAEFGVSEQAVSHINCGTTWREVAPAQL